MKIHCLNFRYDIKLSLVVKIPRGDFIAFFCCCFFYNVFCWFEWLDVVCGEQIFFNGLQITTILEVLNGF